MTRMTTKQINDINNSRECFRIVGLGTRIDNLEYGSLPVPATGTVTTMTPPVKYTTAPALGTATYVHAAVTLTTAKDVTTGITNPDYPRVVTVKGNAAGIAGDVVITGTDINDASITDTIALNESTEVLGVKAFKTITNIHLPAKTNSSGDTVSVGVGNKIGFPVAIKNASYVLAKSFDGSADSSTITTGTSASVSLAAVAGTFNGVKLYELVFIS